MDYIDSIYTQQFSSLIWRMWLRWYSVPTIGKLAVRLLDPAVYLSKYLWGRH